MEQGNQENETSVDLLCTVYYIKNVGIKYFLQYDLGVWVLF